MCNYSQLLKELSSMYHEGEKILIQKAVVNPHLRFLWAQCIEHSSEESLTLRLLMLNIK